MYNTLTNTYQQIQSGPITTNSKNDIIMTLESLVGQYRLSNTAYSSAKYLGPIPVAPINLYMWVDIKETE